MHALRDRNLAGTYGDLLYPYLTPEAVELLMEYCGRFTFRRLRVLVFTLFGRGRLIRSQERVRSSSRK